ncbi:MAG: L-serine ammonia-lyase, iron-sulfur-dependent, subunit alpha [Candidatus Merdivicinus sp.]|jgi:L-serine dehydratase
MNAIQILEICSEHSLSLSSYALREEIVRNGGTEESIRSRFSRMLEVMENSASHARKEPVQSVSGLTGGDAFRYEQFRMKGDSLLGDTVSLAVAYALSCSEVNASMGRIVACPTAGSCGIVPAAVLAVANSRQIPREKQIDALLCAGLIGQIIGEHACLAGAQGGCQAECGSASAMAAAAVTEMLGGNPDQAFHAAAIAIKNVLGLVCDPVGGLVEIPCIKRNAGGVVNAMLCADLALAGIQSRIPFDDVVAAMDQVGKQLPASLRETAAGGLATTRAGLDLAKKIGHHGGN